MSSRRGADLDIVLPTLASLGGAKSTVGVGLPTFLGRIAGDLHYNDTTDKEYVLTGLAGTAYNSGFTGANGTNVVGTNTETGGLTWTLNGQNGTATIQNNAAVHDVASGDSRGASINIPSGTTAKRTVQQVFSIASAITDTSTNCGFYLATTVGSIINGYYFVWRPSGGGGGSQTVDIRYANSQFANITLTTLGFSNATLTRTLTAELNPGNTSKFFVDGVLVATHSTPATMAGTWDGFGMQKGQAAQPTLTGDNWTDTLTGTLAWTPTWLDPTLSGLGYTAPTLTSLGGAKSTVGSGLPSFAGRNAGDLHYDQSIGREYVLTGAPGVYGTDDFTAADGTTITNRIAPLGGITWKTFGASQSYDPVIYNNRAHVVSGSGFTHIAAQLAVGKQTIGFDMITGPGNIMTPILRFNEQALGNQTGSYWVVYGTSNMTVYRNNVLVGTYAYTQPSFQMGTNRNLRLEAEYDGAGVLKAYVNGVLQFTYTDGAPLAQQAFARLTDAFNTLASATGIDNLTMQAAGTLAWIPIQAIYLTDRVPGAIAVANNIAPPGMRVPATTTARTAQIRLGTVPTGTDMIVLFQRYNGGVFVSTIATVTVPAGTGVGTVTGLTAGLASGDMIQLDVTQVGSGVAGADLRASLDCW